MFVLVMFLLQGFSCYSQYQSFRYSPWYRRQSGLNLNLTYFYRLESYHMNADGASESSYPWIARVVHSRTNNIPYLCTASCVDKYIFITTARCVYLLKIKYTSIIYQKQRLTVKALVTPSKESKQQYDDIGFIIVNDGIINNWETVKVYKEKRTDNVFEWFDKRELDKLKYKVVGYARWKTSNAYPLWRHLYELKELKVIMNMKLCPNILPFSKGVAAFKVPCYHSCTLKEFEKSNPQCDKYHGVEGGAVINIKSNELMAIATWGSFYSGFELPVGVAMANSDNYFEDYICATKNQRQ